MTFTKSEVYRMKEAEFQQKVLIPLFNAMQFRNVTSFGGGNLERGKDIVMWKESDLEQRLNYGVVVKAKKITGNAETNNGAMNVLNQVRQMLKTPFQNPVSGKSEHIQRCIVACSKDISKEAMNSIQGELENDLDKLVEWLHPGTNLFELIEKHLPEQGIIEKLSSVQAKLDEAMKIVPYRLVADSDLKFSLLPKHEKAFEEMPFVIKTKFKFDTTPEGKEAFERLREHFTKGSQVEIEGKFIESFELPDFIPELLKPQITDNGRLIIGESRSEDTVPISFERKFGDNETVNSGGLDFSIIEGTEEITFINDRQKTPLQCKITYNLKEKTFKFDFTYQVFGFNVFEHLQALRFFTSMSKEGEMDIYRTDIGLKLPFSQKIKIALENSFERDIALLEALVLIQQKISILPNLAEGNLTNESIKNIFEVAEIIKSGKLVGKMSEFIAEVSLESARNNIRGFENEVVNHVVVTYSEEQKYIILGNEVNLGVAVLSTNVFISKNNFKKIEKNIAENKDTMEFCLTPVDEKTTIDFLKWDCEDRNTRLQIKEAENLTN